MDAFTHGVASYCVTRATFPRASRATFVAAIVAGMAADVDQFSAYLNPAAFLRWHRTATHSLVGTLVIVGVVLLVTMLGTRRNAIPDRLPIVLTALLLTSVLHLGIDLTQNETVQLLWPFRAQRYAADWVAHFDLWILMMLLAGVLLPQLLALVTEEIGAKSKAPRGRIGAIVALSAIFIYVGGRSILHVNAVAMLAARAYRGELPRRIAAFAESDLPFHWRGLVETERAFHELDMTIGPGSSFNPDSAVVYYKPESSAPLDSARATQSVRLFLQTARFPKATVEKTTIGYTVQIQDLAESRESRSGPHLMALVETDANAKVLNDELAWDQKL
jgi:membrane-bound metal-dependent hydrolase YbcI (DUF457 family)